MASLQSRTVASAEFSPRIYHYRDKRSVVALLDELPSWVTRWQIDWLCQPGNLERSERVIVGDNGNIAACQTSEVARAVVHRWVRDGAKDFRWAICRVAPRTQW
jgi:hypothetical protein